MDGRKAYHTAIIQNKAAQAILIWDNAHSKPKDVLQGHLLKRKPIVIGSNHIRENNLHAGKEAVWVSWSFSQSGKDEDKGRELRLSWAQILKKYPLFSSILVIEQKRNCLKKEKVHSLDIPDSEIQTPKMVQNFSILMCHKELGIWGLSNYTFHTVHAPVGKV